jgi:anthranilate phosphoribosyltransferase
VNQGQLGMLGVDICGGGGDGQRTYSRVCGQAILRLYVLLV